MDNNIPAFSPAETEMIYDIIFPLLRWYRAVKNRDSSYYDITAAAIRLAHAVRPLAEHRS